MTEVINRDNSVSPLLASEKIGKKKIQTVNKPKPKSQGLETSRAPPQKGKKTKTNDDALITIRKSFPIQNVVKEDHALNKKVLEAAEAYTKNSTNLTELLTLVKNFDFPGFKTTIVSLQAVDSISLLPQAMCIPTTVGGEFNTHCNYKSFVPSPEPSQHEGDQVNMNVEPTQTVIPPTQYLKTPITPEGIVIKLSTKPVTKEKDTEGVEVTMEHVQEPHDTKPIPITIVMPIAKSAPEVEHVGSSSSRPQLTDTVIDITPPE
ncbi:hypothetical protein Tco_0319752 [Tanacetum coccineum]